MDRLIIWFWHRYRPREGWLLFGLTWLILWLSVSAVISAEWVPESRPIQATFWVATCVSYLIIWRPHIRPSIHIFLLVCFICGAALLGSVNFQFRPLFSGDWQQFSQDFSLGATTFWAKLSGWMQAVSTGQSSAETAVFALGLALLVGGCVAFMIWQVYRRKRPVVMIFSLLFLLGLNSYFSGSRSANILFVILFGTVYLVMWEQFNRETHWRKNEIDHSDDMLMTTTVVSAGITLVLLLGSIFLPSVPYSEIARRFQQSALVQAFEDRFEQAFAGVNTAANRPGTDGPPVAGGGQSSVGILPRQYLLGNPPELAETPVFLADVRFSQPPVGPLHWRASSFDVYTGRGWRRSDATEVVELATKEQLPSLIPISNSAGQINVEQTVTWSSDGRFSNLLTIGLPTQFSQPVKTHLRPFNDLSRVSNPTQFTVPSYQASSRLALRNPSSLNQLEITPDQFDNLEFYTHYTTLPPNIPERVFALAQQVTPDAQTPFEQALQLEQFLRQYTYNLDIQPIPDNVDPVDYFLFDLQEGYCDLYASSMVVMARSLGLPARLGIGYLHPQPREDGRFLITQDLGHSWAEIYFPGVGWVEFEPTATFPIAAEFDPLAQGQPNAATTAETPPVPEAMPLPEQTEPLVISPVFYLLAALLLGWMGLLTGRWVQRRNEPKTLGDIVLKLQAFAQKIDYPADASQTLAEFSAGLQQFLRGWVEHNQLSIDDQTLSRQIGQVVASYERDLYDKTPLAAAEVERSIGTWRLFQRPLRNLIWAKRWQNFMRYFSK